MPSELTAYVPTDHMPRAMADDVERHRATVAGRFALRLYREDRGTPGRPSPSSPRAATT